METEEAGDSMSAEDSSDVDKEAEEEGEEDGGEEQNTRKLGGKRKRWFSCLISIVLKNVISSCTMVNVWPSTLGALILLLFKRFNLEMH